MSPTQQPMPQLPQPVMLGETVGRKPKPKPMQSTFLGDDTANPPTSMGVSSGKTFLGQ